MGAGIGCRFVGAAIDQLHKEMGASIGAAVILIGCAVVFAKLTVALTGLNLDATVLSYAPGGFAEMSLIGLALGIESGDGGDPPSLPPVPDRADEPVHLALCAHARTVMPPSTTSRWPLT